jgi:uncharacterized tellurite resistance protein B-like protein
MLDAIRKLVSQRMNPSSATPVEAGGPTPIQLAACALLLEVAHADEEFSEPERAHILDALARHFALDGDTAAELLRLAEAERQQSIDHFQFTRLINDSYDHGQKMVLAEVLWGAALSDGNLAAHESYLVRKIANLLRLEPGYLNEARRAAANRRSGRE